MKRRNLSLRHLRIYFQRIGNVVDGQEQINYLLNSGIFLTIAYLVWIGWGIGIIFISLLAIGAMLIYQYFIWKTIRRRNEALSVNLKRVSTWLLLVTFLQCWYEKHMEIEDMITYPIFIATFLFVILIYIIPELEGKSRRRYYRGRR